MVITFISWVWNESGIQGMDSRHGLTWSSAQGFKGLQSRCQPYHGSQQKLRIVLLAHLGYWQIPAACGCRTIIPVFLLSGRDHFLLPEAIQSFLLCCPIGSSTWMLAFFQVSKSSAVRFPPSLTFRFSFKSHPIKSVPPRIISLLMYTTD